MTSFAAPTLRVTCLIFCVGLFTGCHHPQRWTLQPKSVPPPPVLGNGQDDSQEFNVDWADKSINQSPLNPQWGLQKKSQTLPPQACTSKPYTCTGQGPGMDKPTGLNGLLCAAAAGGVPFYGHADWGVVEYQGAIGWYNFNFWDGDYCLAMKPKNLEGVTQQNFPQGLHPNNPQFIELEFDSRETAPNFGDNDNWWWPRLSRKAFDGLFNGFDDLDSFLHPDASGNAKKTLACGVVTGVFGLDCDHGCRSEVHPVYTLAVQTDESPQHNQWAVLVRNWGAGGFCSGWNDEMNASRMEVLLPVTSSSQGPEVKVEQFAGTAGVGCPTYGYVDGKGEELSFDLPAPTPETQGMAVMLVTLKWPDGADTMHCTEVDVSEFRKLRDGTPGAAKETDAEGQLVTAMRAAGLGPKPGEFRRDVSQPYLMSHPASPTIQKMMLKTMQGQAVCPAPEKTLQMKLAQPVQEFPRTKLVQDKAAEARNEAMLAALCREHANGKAWPENLDQTVRSKLEKACNDKRIKGK